MPWSVVHRMPNLSTQLLCSSSQFWWWMRNQGRRRLRLKMLLRDTWNGEVSNSTIGRRTNNLKKTYQTEPKIFRLAQPCHGGAKPTTYVSFTFLFTSWTANLTNRFQMLNRLFDVFVWRKMSNYEIINGFLVTCGKMGDFKFKIYVWITSASVTL